MAEYEFTEEQNKIINGFSLRLITQSVLFGLAGVVITIIALLTFKSHTPVTSVIYVLQGIFLILSGLRSLRRGLRIMVRGFFILRLGFHLF